MIVDNDKSFKEYHFLIILILTYLIVGNIEIHCQKNSDHRTQGL